MPLTRRDMLALGGTSRCGALLPSRFMAQMSIAAPQAAPDPITQVNPQFRAQLQMIERDMGPMPTMSAANLAPGAGDEQQFRRPAACLA